MKRFPLFVVVAGATLIGARHFLAKRGRCPDFAAMRRKMMDRMMEAMPEDSPPKLIKSVLPRLKEQNDQILALLEEQNELLRHLNTKR